MTRAQKRHSPKPRNLVDNQQLSRRLKFSFKSEYDQIFHWWVYCLLFLTRKERKLHIYLIDQKKLARLRTPFRKAYTCCMDSPERPIWTSLSASSGSCSTGSLLRWPWQPRTRHPPPSSCPLGWWWSSCRWMGGWVVLWVQLLLSGWRSIGRKQRASEGGRGLLSQLANPKSNLSWISIQL